MQAGELVIVLGSNGSGKSTLLRCIARALVPTEGEVWLNGTAISGLTGEGLRRARLALAMISQHANLVRRRSVLANVACGALGRHGTWWTALGGLPEEELPAARDPGQVGLADLAGQRAGTLSGGQAQRVAIARALAQRPRVMLADEPVASLDPEAPRTSCACCAASRSDGLAVLCVLHQLELAFAYADRVVGMRDGRVAFDRHAPTCRVTQCSGCISRKPHEGRRRYRDPHASALVVAVLVVVQSLIVVQARPQDLITGFYGMVDIIRRATPPDFSKLPDVLWPTLETIDIAIFGTVAGVGMALPLAVLAATNVTPSRPSTTRRARPSASPARCPTWSGRCCSSPRSGSGRFRAGWRWRCIRSACSAGCSPRRSRTWTWRRSTRCR